MPKGPSWTAGEDAVIREVYPASGRKGVVARLPHRTEASVKARAKFLRVQYEREDSWSSEDIAHVEKHYAIDGYRAVGAALGRSPGSVASLASKLELTTVWTASDDAAVREFFPVEGAHGLAARLGRRAEAIARRAELLRVSFDDPGSWKPDQDAYLIEHYSKDGPEKVAQALGRSYGSVTSRASFQSLPAPGKLTEVQQERLRATFMTAERGELAVEFGRRFTAVAAHAYRLGLERPREKFAEVSRLLDGSLQAAYWIGFLLADGHIANNRIEVNLAPRDREHLERFAHFLGKSVTVRDSANGKMVRLSCGDAEIMPEVVRKWGFHHRKTYNPPDFSLYEAITLDELIAVVIGLFDGDGTTDGRTNRTSGLAAGRRLSQGRLCLHRTWSGWLTKAVERVSRQLQADTSLPVPYTILASTRLDGFAAKIAMSGNGDTPMVRWMITPAMMRAFKSFIETHRLVVLERKWWFLHDEVSRKSGPRREYLKEFIDLINQTTFVLTERDRKRSLGSIRKGLGVCYSRQNKGWMVYVRLERSNHYLGTFTDKACALNVWAEGWRQVMLKTENML